MPRCKPEHDLFVIISLFKGSFKIYLNYCKHKRIYLHNLGCHISDVYNICYHFKGGKKPTGYNVGLHYIHYNITILTVESKTSWTILSRYTTKRKNPQPVKLKKTNYTNKLFVEIELLLTD